MKKIVLILSSWAFILLACYTALEASVLYWLPYVFPISSVMAHLDPDIQVLAQYSKRGEVPRNYIAIFGDSYAFGQGDWLLHQQGKPAPFYNTTHLLHEKMKRDVVSFGRPASSSIKGYLEDPISQLAFIRSIKTDVMEDPAIAILYFYEGNDVVDNWKEFNVRYQGRGYLPADMNEDGKFSEFIDRNILQENNTIKRSKNLTLSDKLIFLRFSISLLKNESIRLSKYIENQINPKPHRPIFKPQPREHNKILVSSRKENIPDRLQVPPVALLPDEIDISMKIFERTLREVRKRWPNTRFGIVYVPSVATAYHIVSDSVNIYDVDRGKTYESSLILPSSDSTCSRIQKIAHSNGMYFLDARPAIRQAAEGQLLHGPVDWLHFNEAGYRVLSDEIEKIISNMESPVSAMPCEKISSL